MKNRSVNAQLWTEMVNMLNRLIRTAAIMIVPSPGKEELLDEAREILKRANKQDEG
jgi:hypothetical protein